MTLLFFREEEASKMPRAEQETAALAELTGSFHAIWGRGAATSPNARNP